MRASSKVKDNRSYWEDRERQKLNVQMKDVNKLENNLKKAYRRSSDDIHEQIEILFQRYAKDNKLNFSDANKLLASAQYRSWRKDIREYVDEIKKSGDKELLLELNTLAVRSRATILNEKLFKVDKTIDELYKTYKNGTDEFLGVCITDSYYKTAFDIQKFTGVGSPFALVDDVFIQKVLSYPWSGANYSSRIWDNRKKLKKVIRQDMTQMIIQGRSSDYIARSISKRLDTDYKHCLTLVNTEHSYVMSEASNYAMGELGVSKYQFLATLDGRTSDMCQNLDGQVFELKDRAIGLNASPMHCRCRSTEIPYFDDIEAYKSTRTARIGEGKTYSVDEDMTYKEWSELNRI